MKTSTSSFSRNERFFNKNSVSEASFQESMLVLTLICKINSGRSFLVPEITQQLIEGYFPIFVFLGIAIGLSLLMVVLAYLRAHSLPNPEKLSPYECGFDPFSDTRHKFDVRFYLVAILFIIFDLEIAFLFPWAAAFDAIGFAGYFSMMLFLFLLTIGFIYEWKKGALDWE